MKEKRKTEQVKKDYYSAVLSSQIICCALVVSLFYLILNSSMSYTLKNAYASLLKEDFLTDKTSPVVSAVSDYLSEKGGTLAVFGNKVVPYEEATELPETTTTEAFSENKTVFEPDKVSEIALSYEKKTDNKPLAEKKTTSIIFPVEDGRYTSLFGERVDPISDDDAYHHGIDIGADSGDRIRAVANGMVRETGEDSISGKYVILTHSDRYETVYCHCSELLAKEGSIIRQGETIALVGSTGYSTGPHLHFEIRRDGECVDPLPYLENAY